MGRLMSFSESSFNFPEPTFLKAIPGIPAPVRPAEPLDKLTEALDGLLIIRSAEPVKQGNRRGVIIFTGRLLDSAETLYNPIVQRFRGLGYTPMLERYHNEDVVVALPGLARTRRFNSPWWLHLLLLIVTTASTILSGAQLAGFSIPDVWDALFVHFQLSVVLRAVQIGAPFALTLLLILGVHEMGHYVAARFHHLNVTLPFFIPLPIIGLLGTLGAVIFIKDPLANRKSLFDVGISGPLAGFAVALPAFVIGLRLPPVGGTTSAFDLFSRALGYGFRGLGMPPLLDWVGHAIVKEDLGVYILNHPVALAAWFGVLLTVLNLLPLGQLDGGHVMYTLFGRAAWIIALATFFVLLFLGLTVYSSFLFYAALALLTGLRHPPPGNDITPLDPTRKLIGLATVILFGLIVTLTPFLMQG